MHPREAREYVLGTHDEEVWRLGFQHRIWAESATALWERGGLTRGQAALDVGCGPGYATRDLATIVGPTGRVVGVDVSERFLEAVRAIPTPSYAAPIELINADVQEMTLEPGAFDFAWCRWVMCYLPNPGAVVNAVARALKPGGVFCVQDYSYYRGVRIAPMCPAFDNVFDAVVESVRLRGGDLTFGEKLPRLMVDAGLEIQEIRPLIRLARPGSMLWNWPGTFFPIFLPALVEMGLLTEEDRLKFDREWARRSNDPAAFFMSPPMVEVIGVKRG